MNHWSIQDVAAIVAIVGALATLLVFVLKRAQAFQDDGMGWADIVLFALAILFVSASAVYLFTRTT